MFDRLRRLFTGKGQPEAPAKPAVREYQPPSPGPATAAGAATATTAAGTQTKKPASEGAPAAAPTKPLPEKPEPPTVAELKKKSAEAVCGIDPKTMDREQIRKRLAELYRRHNQAASSLNEELRKEAEVMLDAIVECRSKYVG